MQSIQSSKALHVAIIMDGNGRWGEARGLGRSAGHEAGARAVRGVVTAAAEAGLGTLTLYAVSSDNFRRPPAEVGLLLLLVGRYLHEEGPALIEAGIRLSVIGRRDRLPPRLRRAIAALEAASADGTRLHLRIALDYSGRDAILAAAARAGLGDLTREGFSQLLGDGPEVDLLIRTSGEQRLSDFLIWESAYAELLFTPTLWPDFGAGDLEAALAWFTCRRRRFGGLADRAA